MPDAEACRQEGAGVDVDQCAQLDVVGGADAELGEHDEADGGLVSGKEADSQAA